MARLQRREAGSPLRATCDAFCVLLLCAALLCPWVGPLSGPTPRVGQGSLLRLPARFFSAASVGLIGLAQVPLGSDLCTTCNDAPTGPPALHAKGSHAIQTLLPSKETQQLLKRHLPVKPSVMSFKALRMPTWASNAGPTEAMAPGRRRMLQL